MTAKTSGTKRSKLGFDPLQKNLGEKTKSEYNLAPRYQNSMGYSRVNKSWTGNFVMARVNSQIVRRSNALLGYSKLLRYEEASVQTNFFRSFNTFVGLIIFATTLFNPPVTWLLRKFVLPKPGQGPSEATRKRYFLRVKGYGTGSEGTKAKATLYFHNDPGYVDTARMLVETGLSIALRKDIEKVRGGYHTTASCCGDILLKRLLDTGCVFDMEILEDKKDK